MIRGTTPIHTFELPFRASELSSAYITYSQSGKVKFEKQLSDCECEGNKLSVRLTQAETLSLRPYYNTDIQIAVKCDEVVMRSDIITVPTEHILKDGEI